MAMKERNNTISMKKTAKIIRIITIPTLIFFVVFWITYFTRNEFFRKLSEVLVPTICLGIVPILAYPIACAIGKKKDAVCTRDLQRKLAFIFSIAGYTLSFVLGFIFKFGNEVMLLASTYFFTVVFLTLFNAFHIKASGHAAGIAGPMILLIYYIGYIYIIPCLIVYGLAFWSSIYLKRHTIIQFLLGTLSTILAFIVSILMF